MRVTVDQYSGFCWGVVRTVEIAEEELKTTPKMYSLGPVIHNPEEIDRLAAKGLATITLRDFEQVQGQKVLIRAHGEPPSTYELARNNNITLIDATCPVVTKVQERIRKFHDKGYQVVIFGKKDHAEVVGLVGVTDGKAVVIQSVDDITKLDLTRKTVLFSQTTMDKTTFYEIVEALKSRVSELEVGTFEESAIDFHAKDTICGQVSGREKKLREFAARNDVVIFVAGRSSSNGKVLYEICRETNPQSHFIEDETELKQDWFRGCESVGISGATSTPQWLMDRVKQAIEDSTGIELSRAECS